jgi:RNA polymerase sigma-70 factor (ECF subfamily)
MAWAKTNVMLLAAIVIGGAGGMIAAETAMANNAVDESAITLANVPPVVVKTVPEAGADNVDPSTTQIKITYSKPMHDPSWSWSTASEENFPKITGKPHYEANRRTCVAPVRLEPGHTYAIWLNSEKFGGFRDADGHKAVPYLLVFQTRK